MDQVPHEDAAAGGGAEPGFFDGADLPGMKAVVAVFAAFALVWATVHALGDLLGRRAGRAVAAIGLGATLILLHDLVSGTGITGIHALVRALGAWPVAALATFAVWSALGVAPAIHYIRRRPHPAA